MYKVRYPPRIRRARSRLAAQDLCNCGQRGCLEAIASRPKIIRQYAERTGAASCELRFIDVLERARRGDADALAVFERAGRAIGSGLSPGRSER